VKKTSVQSQPDSIRSDDESEYTYDEEEEEEEEEEEQTNGQKEKDKNEMSYEAQAEKILEDPNVSKDVSPDLVTLCEKSKKKVKVSLISIL
jgi:FMN phosphatase YigB (HAD superfamily)